MNTLTPLKFESESWGSLELEIEESKRNSFPIHDVDKIPFSVKGFGKSDWDCEPIYLFEWQKVQYSYIIDLNTSFYPPFELRINNRTEKKSQIRGKNHLLVGQFSFNDTVGETKIEIRDKANQLIFELSTEVYPQKMDYKSDYKAMMADISMIIQNLAFDSLKDTFKKTKAKLKGQATENEWWNILDALFDVLIINLGVIKRQPKHEIRKQEKVLPVDKIKTASKKNLTWFRKNGKYSSSSNSGVRVTPDKTFTHALTEKKFVTYDIYENRFIAWAVKIIIDRLRVYKKHIANSKGTGDYSAIINQIQKYQSRLQGILHESPFNETSSFEKISHFSNSLTRGAGYRDFMHIYLLLMRGLELADNDIFKIEQKDISKLYEYWCFLKLVQLLKEQTSNEIEYQDLIKIESSKFRVKLKSGNASEVHFKKKDSEETIKAYYNKEFRKDGKKVFTYNQKPDYSIEFKKNGFEKPFWYLFDAKYRFEEDRTLDKNKYNVPQDAIGQLHRYRDAILHTEPTNSTYRAAIKNLGGIILYPYPLGEAEFTSNDYFNSINQVNIGALPFLPSKSNLVSELLNQMINKTAPEEHFERFIEMDNSEYVKQRDSWKEWVTIGTVPKIDQQERLQFILDKSIFHIPHKRNLNSKIPLTKKILISKAGTKEAILFDVKNWEILSDNELINLGVSWNLRTNKYVVFHLKNPKEINIPDLLSPISYRYSTWEGLNRFLKSPQDSEKCFYLTNPDAARLHDELVKNKIQFGLKWSENENDPSLIQFQYKDYIIYSSDKFPDLHFRLGREYLYITEILNLLISDSN